jgi:predicted dehydrogenase
MLKAGFIGFGRMGITHLSILNTHPSVQIVSVCDHSSTMMNILKKYKGMSTYSDYRKMLEEVPLDFVIISTATDSHSEIIKHCLEKGLHVFVEKPFSLCSADAQETLACLDGKELVNQVGYVIRFNEVFMEVKKLLDAGVIGDVKGFSAEMYSATVLKDSKESWRSKKKAGGGCMYEIASHCIDLTVYLMGMPDRVAGSVVKSVYSSAVDDMVSSTFIYKNGVSGIMSANWCDEAYRKPTNIVKIFGAKGKIIADKHAYKIYMKEPDTANGFHKGWNTRYITDFARNVRFYLRGNEFTAQLDYFVDCIEKGKTDNISSFSEAMKTDLLIEEIARDAAENAAGFRSELSPILNDEQRKRKSFLEKLFSLKKPRDMVLGAWTKTS